MANRPMERCSMSSVIAEMQVIRRYHFTPIGQL